MEIEKVDAIPVAAPIRPFRDAYASYDSVAFVLLVIEDDEGHVGYGEASAWSPQFYGETVESITVAVKKYFAPAIIGENPLSVGRVLAIVDSVLPRSTCAKTGLDLALYDLVGKILNVPVAVLLGGFHRGKVLAASEIAIESPEVMAEQARELVRMSFKVIKLKVGTTHEEDAERIRAVWNAVGDKAIIRVDPNAGWTRHGTIELLQRLRDVKLECLEQPIPGWDLCGLAEIKRATGITLMVDESIWTPQDVVSIAMKSAADIVNIKITKAGGLNKSKKIYAVAEAVGLPCIVGTELEPSVGIAGKLHLAASFKALPFACEFTELAFLKDNILKQRIELKDGFLEVPSGPGLGVEPNMNKVNKYKLNLTLE